MPRKISGLNTLNEKLLEKARACYGNQIQRCRNKNTRGYKTYGALGINVDYSFSEFKEWYIENYPDKDFTLRKWCVGRLDHSKSYSLDNIQFQATRENTKEVLNRRGPVHKERLICVIEIKTHAVLPSIKMAAKYAGRSVQSVHYHLKNKGMAPRNKYYFFEMKNGGIK